MAGRGQGGNKRKAGRYKRRGDLISIRRRIVRSLRGILGSLMNLWSRIRPVENVLERLGPISRPQKVSSLRSCELAFPERRFEGVDGRWTIANTPRSVSLADNLRRGFMGG